MGDFIVKEVNKDNINHDVSFKSLNFPYGKEKEYIKAVLVKEGISTFDAVIQLAKFMGINSEEIKYHGLKDTFGLTSQEISLPSKKFLNQFDKLKRKKFDGFFIKELVFTSKECLLRQIVGNHFVIKLRNYSDKNIGILKDINNRRFPNYYGHQRFGVRQINHLVGKELIKKEYEMALKIFCTKTNENEDNRISKIRKKILDNWGNWEKCFKIVNKVEELKDEKLIFSYLCGNEKDFVKALDATGLSKLLVNSYSSYLFNKILIEIGEKNKFTKYLPVIGYKTKFTDLSIKKKYFDFLKRDSLNQKDFKNSDYPSLSYGGRDKVAYYVINNFKWSISDADLILEFTLPMGVYANLFLDNLIENTSNGVKLE
jgi:tRNA pseudouridine13 synthase